MGIKAAYMVPHPPLIVPAVGRGGERISSRLPGLTSVSQSTSQTSHLIL